MTVNASISFAVVLLVVNLYVVARAFYRAWQLSNDQRLSARATKMFLVGMGGYNLIVGVVFLIAAITGATHVLGIERAWFYVGASILEKIPFLILDIILSRYPDEPESGSDEIELFVVLDYLRRVIAAPVYHSYPKEVKDFLHRAEDGLANIVATHSLMRQAKEMRGDKTDA